MALVGRHTGMALSALLVSILAWTAPATLQLDFSFCWTDVAAWKNLEILCGYDMNLEAALQQGPTILVLVNLALSFIPLMFLNPHYGIELSSGCSRELTTHLSPFWKSTGWSTFTPISNEATISQPRTILTDSYQCSLKKFNEDGTLSCHVRWHWSYRMWCWHHWAWSTWIPSMNWGDHTFVAPDPRPELQHHQGDTLIC